MSSGAAKAILSYCVGKRNQDHTSAFVADLRARMLGAPEISSDGWNCYPGAIEDAFGIDVTYGQIEKHHGVQAAIVGAARRYSPARVVAVNKRRIIGRPRHISTSEDFNRFSTSPDCHLLLHAIAGAGLIRPLKFENRPLTTFLRRARGTDRPYVRPAWALHYSRPRPPFPNCPNVIRDAELHGGCDAQRLVNAAKIIMRSIKARPPPHDFRASSQSRHSLSPSPAPLVCDLRLPSFSAIR